MFAMTLLDIFLSLVLICFILSILGCISVFVWGIIYTLRTGKKHNKHGKDGDLW